jgi:hypothetical protein
MADEPTEAAGGTDVPLTDLLEQTISVALKRMAGPVYGTVDTYDAATERCSVKPLVPLLVNGELLEAPKLPSVPVEWPSNGGSHSYKFPLIKGSKVKLAPLGHDHTEWFTTATPDLKPPSERRFSLADLVASPLVPSPLASSPDPLSYDATNTKAVLFGEHLIGGSDATKATALHLDDVNKDASLPAADFASWMAAVDIGIAAAGGGTVSPAATSITKIGAVQATATKLKAK